MGWISDWWYKDDPLHSIDPKLREFLEKEAPKRYHPTPAAVPEPQTYREQLGLATHNNAERQKLEQDARKRGEPLEHQIDKPTPPESLFPDGRYKHLWASYRPQSEVDQAGKSDQEKLTDIVHAYQDRQAEVKRAALENCADEQFNLHDCFRNGGWASRMTMCREESKSLNKCVMMQTKFLRALGYASIYDRTEVETESIQMHADTLYHRMLEQERAITEAKEKGEPAPALPPLMESVKDRPPHLPPVQSKSPDVIKFDELPADVQRRLAKDKLTGLEGPQLELAKQELEEEIALNQDMVRRINERWSIDRRERLKRLAQGEERFSDKIMRWFDMRKYPDDD